MENQRVRSINVQNLDDEQIKAIELKLGEKIKPIITKAIDDVNEFLNPYGLAVNANFKIVENVKE